MLMAGSLASKWVIVIHATGGSKSLGGVSTKGNRCRKTETEKEAIIKGNYDLSFSFINLVGFLYRVQTRLTLLFLHVA